MRLANCIKGHDIEFYLGSDACKDVHQLASKHVRLSSNRISRSPSNICRLNARDGYSDGRSSVVSHNILFGHTVSAWSAKPGVSISAPVLKAINQLKSWVVSSRHNWTAQSNGESTHSIIRSHIVWASIFGIANRCHWARNGSLLTAHRESWIAEWWYCSDHHHRAHGRRRTRRRSWEKFMCPFTIFDRY